jgi:predicted deacetylase
MRDTERKLLVSLHDVSPRHAQAVRRILAWLAERGLPPVQLLVVPDFHGEWPLSAYPDFCQELRAWGEFGHELVLHGYYHRESERAEPKSPGLGERFQRRFMTAGEGEFLSLPPVEADALLEKGLSMWNQAELGAWPQGFIPPAWLHRPDLDGVLWKRGFRWTENHAGLRFRDGKRLVAPVITWASRDPVRRIGSRIYCPAAVRLNAKAALLRLAIHPHDFDHPQLIRSIDRTLELARRHRRPTGSTDFDQAT